MLLEDDHYDQLFSTPGDDGASHDDPLWTLLCFPVSEWLSQLTGLPVDYQIQRRTEANTKFANESRNPMGILGTWSLTDLQKET